jgi:mono/diheme cytochrome c family protein
MHATCERVGGHIMGVLRWIGCSGVIVALASGPWASGQAATSPEPAAGRGRQLFRTYCASCHGTAGRGDGPTSQYLTVPPANLTALAARNKGMFPADAIHRAIDGRQTVRAHGNSAMPIWGDAFAPAERTATERIRDLVTYLESIQAHTGND